MILREGQAVCLIKGYDYHLLYSVFKDREAFAALVREVASPDVGRMGIEILSFTIKDIIDHVSYLDSLGKTQTDNCSLSPAGRGYSYCFHLFAYDQ